MLGRAKWFFLLEIFRHGHFFIKNRPLIEKGLKNMNKTLLPINANNIEINFLLQKTNFDNRKSKYHEITKLFKEFITYFEFYHLQLFAKMLSYVKISLTKGAFIYHVVRFSGILTPLPPRGQKHGHLADPPIKPRGHSRNPHPQISCNFFECFYNFLSYLCEAT